MCFLCLVVTWFVRHRAALKLWFVHLRERLSLEEHQETMQLSSLRRGGGKDGDVGAGFTRQAADFCLPFLLFLPSIIPSPYGAPNPSSHKRLKDRNLERPEVEGVTSERERTEREGDLKKLRSREQSL